MIKFNKTKYKQYNLNFLNLKGNRKFYYVL